MLSSIALAPSQPQVILQDSLEEWLLITGTLALDVMDKLKVCILSGVRGHKLTIY